jgi:hypothetical protein
VEVEDEVPGDEFPHFPAEAFREGGRVGPVPAVRVGPRHRRERGRRPALAIIRRPFQSIQVAEEAQALAHRLDDANKKKVPFERQSRGRGRRVPQLGPRPGGDGPCPAAADDLCDAFSMAWTRRKVLISTPPTTKRNCISSGL